MMRSEPTIWLFCGCLAVATLSPLIRYAVRRDDPHVDLVPLLLLALSFSCLGYVAWFLDDWLGLSAYWTFTAVFAAWGAAPALIVAGGRRSPSVAAISAVYLAGLVALHFVDTSPLKPYRRFYANIEDDMTPDEVLVLLRQEFPAGGRFPMPYVRPHGPSHMGFNLDLTDGRYDAETIDLDLVDGRVTAKVYSGD